MKHAAISKYAPMPCFVPVVKEILHACAFFSCATVYDAGLPSKGWWILLRTQLQEWW